MSGYFGIDLGTTNSVITQLVAGTPHAIPVDGAPIVPSLVLFDGERVVVGREARNLELEHPERVIRSAKRKMGQAHRYRVGTREVSPEEVSAEVIDGPQSRVWDQAENRLHVQKAIMATLIGGKKGGQGGPGGPRKRPARRR